MKLSSVRSRARSLSVSQALILVAAALQMVPLSAVGQDYGTPGDYLIELYPSARSQAIGGGPVAIVDATDAALVNPGALDRNSQVALAMSYMRLMNAFHFYNVPFVFPFGKFGTVGASVTGITSDEIPRYNAFGVALQGNYRSYDNTLMLSYGKSIGTIAAAGLNVKFANKRIDTESGTGVGFDVGAVVNPLPWLSAGLSMVNIGGPTLLLDKTEQSFSTAIKGGVGTVLLDSTLRINGDIAFEDLLADNSVYAPGAKHTYPLRWSVGTEYWLFPFFALRAGMNDRSVNFGAGFRVRNISPDFAFSYSTDNSEMNPGFNYGFSLAYQFGAPASKMEFELDKRAKDVDRREQLQKGQMLYIRGFTVEARKVIGAYVKENPDDREAAALLKDINGRLASGEVKDVLIEAHKAFDAGDFTKANDLVSRALSIQPGNKEASALNGRLSMIKENNNRLKNIATLYAQKRFEDMARELDVVLQLDSTNAEAKQYREKIADVMKKFEADKHYNLASKLYYEDKDVEKANAELQRTFELVSDHVQAWALYDKIGKEIKEMYLKKVGQMVDAKGLNVENADLRKLIAVDVQDKLMTVRKMLDDKQCDQALANVESVLRDAPADTTARRLKEKALACQQRNRAEGLYNEALKLYNDKSFGDAEKKVGEAVALAPDHQKAQALLKEIQTKKSAESLDAAEKSMASGKRDDFENARKAVEEYLVIDPQNERAKTLQTTITVELLVLDANDHVAKGEYDKADELIQKVLKMDPGNKKVQDAFKALKEVIDLMGN